MGSEDARPVIGEWGGDYRVASGVHLARFEKATIALNLKVDRYVMIAGGLHADLHHALDGHTDRCSSSGSVIKLVSQGILQTDDQSEGKAVNTAVLCERSLLVDIPSTLPTWRCLGILVSLLAAMIDVRRRPLAEIVSELEVLKSHVRECPATKHHRTAHLSLVAASMKLADLIFGTTRWCLPRSICAMRILLKRGLRPSLVMGVMERPFAAHSWVEMGDYVVTDAADRVRPFKPIFVL
ncbi:lasso peptide biosynthesis B2 protein [Novosphingobium rosa]|uniref:lasso peptide biosynthesis B2 protein n=1 Tax=Novosphingobium rosa TaxID=76978 RepID=UPI000A00CC11|nr:lasso peptide biosynthesis B2 protein [Novosphingobium rosa]